MNPFDATITQFVNGFARHSPALDQFVYLLADWDYTAALPLVAALWWLWFRKNDPDRARTHDRLLTGLLAACASGFLARLIAHWLPSRLRPIHVAELGLRLAYGLPKEFIKYRSSFPSGHAAGLVALAVVLFFVSRRLGIAALAFVTFCSLLPRIYLGVHYPTDILAGALIGVIVVVVAMRWASWLALPFLNLERAYPAAFYAGLFIVSFELSSWMRGLRILGEFLAVLRAGAPMTAP